jgi:hypothetical protein
MKNTFRMMLIGAMLIVFAFSQRTASANESNTTSLHAATPPRLLSLRLTVSQHLFKVGQPITIQLSVVNTSPDVISLPPVTPWNAAKLIVRRNDNTIVNPSGAPVQYDWRFAAHTVLEPGQSYTYHWRNSEPPYAFTYFNPISYWGYQELPPGNYVITAIPYHMASFSHRRWIKESSDNYSNSVEIVVQP